MTQRIPAKVQPWLVLGERRKRTLEQRIGAALGRWSARWISAPVAASVTVTPGRSWTSSHGDQRASCFGARRQSQEWVALCSAPRGLAAWAAGEGAVAASVAGEPGNESLAAELEVELLGSLLSELFPRVAAEMRLERVDGVAAEEARAALAKGVLAVTCTMGSAAAPCILWTLSSTAAAIMLGEPRVPYSGAPLVSRRSAAAKTPVGLDCHLGSIQVPVRDLHTLRPGDVLLTEAALESRAEIRMSGQSPAIAAGMIGESGGRRAVKIEWANRGSNR
jgi:Type III flagellar switch regulator (C-ring) FliN C-term